MHVIECVTRSEKLDNLCAYIWLSDTIMIELLKHQQ